MQTRASTIIVAERPLFREGIVSLLQSSGYEVVATASRAAEVQDVLTATQGRALVIFGVAGNHCDYEELSKNIGSFRSWLSDVKIVVVAETAGPVDLQKIASVAPDGYILNLSSREILLKALELTQLDQKIFVLGEQGAPSLAANENGSHQRGTNGDFTANVRAGLPDAPEPYGPPLSPRELEVLIQLSRGDSNKQIAQSCSMAESTVKTHLKTILRKLDVQNRTQAAIVAIASGLLGGEPQKLPLLPSAPRVQPYRTLPDVGTLIGTSAGSSVDEDITIF